MGSFHYPAAFAARLLFSLAGVAPVNHRTPKPSSDSRLGRGHEARYRSVVARENNVGVDHVGRPLGSHEQSVNFEPQNDLEKSLVIAAGDPTHRPQFYRDLAHSDIFVIRYGGPPPPEAERGFTLAAGTPIQLRHFERDGKTYLPIFSSLPRLQAVLKEEATYLRINALELLKIARGTALLLNPGSDYGKEITADEAARIADGSIWQPTERYVTPQATKVLLGQPKNYPTELVDVLTRFLKTKKQVKRAWLAHFFNPERDKVPHTLVVIEASGDFDALSAEAGIVAQSVKIPDPPLDVMRLTGQGGFEDYFVRQTHPFYQKRFLGLC